MNDLPKEGNAFTWGKKLELIFGSEQREESIKIVLGVFLILILACLVISGSPITGLPSLILP